MGGDDGRPRETLATNFRMRGQRYERHVEVKIAMRDPGLAAILSLIIPGIGQFYNGRILAGILWLIITPGLWIGTGGLLGWVAHVVSAYTAYSYARDHRVREAWD
jgi:TM2 domain-containing membrane protein YozV